MTLRPTKRTGRTFGDATRFFAPPRPAGKAVTSSRLTRWRTWAAARWSRPAQKWEVLECPVL